MYPSCNFSQEQWCLLWMHQSSRSSVAQWFEPFSFDVFFCPRGEKCRAEGLHIAVVGLQLQFGCWFSVCSIWSHTCIFEIYRIYLLLLLLNNLFRLFCQLHIPLWVFSLPNFVDMPLFCLFCHFSSFFFLGLTSGTNQKHCHCPCHNWIQHSRAWWNQAVSSNCQGRCSAI